MLAGVLIYLDAVVQEKFSGKRWTIPAKVYARPLELFAGQKLNKQDFLIELNALGYRNEVSARSAGAVSVNGNTVDASFALFHFLRIGWQVPMNHLATIPMEVKTFLSYAC